MIKACTLTRKVLVTKAFKLIKSFKSRVSVYLWCKMLGKFNLACSYKKRPNFLSSRIMLRPKIPKKKIILSVIGTKKFILVKQKLIKIFLLK